MKKLYIAFATFQNGANVFPIYYSASKGDDVVWIESESCKKQKIVTNAHKVLNTIGVRKKKIISMENNSVSDPNNITFSLFGYLTPRIAKQYDEIIILVGGGTKPTSIALYYSALYLNKNYQTVTLRTIYLNYRPIEIIEFDFESQKFKNIALEVKRKLKISQLLEVYGMSMKKEKQTSKHTDWKLFASDIKLVNGWHKIMSIPDSLYGNGEKIPYDSMVDFFPPFKKAIEASIERNITQRVLFKKLDAIILKCKNERLKEVIWPDFKSIITEPKSTHHRHLYAAFNKYLTIGDKKIFSVGVEKKTVQKLKTMGWLKNEAYHDNIKKSDINLKYGTEFERMVKERLDHYLNKRKNIAGLISEIGTNVSIFHQNRMVSEHDIILLLKNGVAISLECKTHTFEIKDALARLMRLSQSSGSISEFVVIAPFFPSLDSEFFKTHHQLKSNIRSLGMKFIGFGKNTTKPSYIYKDEEYPNESFEEGIDKILKPYLRNDKK